MVWPVRIGGAAIPQRLVRVVDDHVAAEHPHEAGGFLACERRGRRLHAIDHVPLPNEADRPGRRFVATVDDRAPPPPRICYHSHTSPTMPSGMTATDRRHIPERYALVVFAPRGEPHSYRLFRRGFFKWHELPVAQSRGRSREPTPLP